LIIINRLQGFFSRAGPSGNGTPGGRQFFPPGGGDQQEAPRTGGPAS